MTHETWRPERDYLGELLAAVSHDIRTPLGVVFGAVRELETDAHPGQEVYLSLIRRTIERLLGLSDSLTDCGQTLQDGMALSPTRFELGAAIREAVETQTGLPSINLTAEGPEVRVTLDRPRLLEALRQLIRWSAMKAETRLTIRWSDSAVVTLDDDGSAPRDGVEPERCRSTSEPNRLRILLPVLFARQLLEAQGASLAVVAGDLTRITVRLPPGALAPEG